MLELLAVLNDPEKILPYPQYPSGLLDQDNPAYKFGLPSTKNPVMRIPYDICNKTGDCLSAGFYEVAISNDKTFLMLIQSSRLRARIPVIKLEEKPFNEEEETKKQKEKAKKEKKMEKTNEKSQEEWRTQAGMSATIEDSKEGYFIIEYKTPRLKAWAYVAY